MESLLDRLRIAGKILLKGKEESPQLFQFALEDLLPLTDNDVAEVKEFFPREKFFIFGHARSGTTLLTRLIRLHPDVHCNYQAHFFTRPPFLQALVGDKQVRSWLSRRSNRWNHGHDLSPLVMRVVADFIMEREAHQNGKRIVGDKSPNSLLNGQAVHLLKKTFPDAYLIFIVRDGRDAIVSHRFQQFIDVVHHLTENDIKIKEAFTKDPLPFFQGKRSLFTEKGLRQSVIGWVENVTETDEQGKALFGNRFYSLRYESLLKDPCTEMNRLWDFLSADITLPILEELISKEMSQNPDADWQRQKASDLISPLEKGKSGSWQTLFTKKDRDIFKEIGGKTLISWQYEKDLGW